VLAFRATRLFHVGQAASLPRHKTQGDKLAACRYTVRAAA